MGSQESTTNTNNSTSGTSSTSNPYFTPQLGGQLQGAAGNGLSFASNYNFGVQQPAIDAFTGALGSQGGLGMQLQPGIMAAGQIAQNGLTPGGQMPYYNSMVTPYLQAQNDLWGQQDALAMQQSDGKAASQGALGNNNGGRRAALLQQANAPARAAATAGTLMGAQDKAYDVYGKSLGTQLQGVQTGTGAIGAGSAINQGWGNLGTGFQQLNQMPVQAFAQYMGALPWQAAGTNTTSQGTSSGTSATETPFDWLGAAAKLGAAGITAYSDARIKENIIPVGLLFDGQTPVFQFNLKGDPTPQIGLIAQEVEQRMPEAVGEDERGIKVVDYDLATRPSREKVEMQGPQLDEPAMGGPGPIPSFAGGAREGDANGNGIPDQVERHFNRFKGMMHRGRNGGGAVEARPGFEWGGMADSIGSFLGRPFTTSGSDENGGWTTTTTPESASGKSFDSRMKGAAGEMSTLGQQSGQPSNPTLTAVNQGQQQLDQFMRGMQQPMARNGGAMQRRGYEEGGTPYMENDLSEVRYQPFFANPSLSLTPRVPGPNFGSDAARDARMPRSPAAAMFNSQSLMADDTYDNPRQPIQDIAGVSVGEPMIKPNEAQAPVDPFMPKQAPYSFASPFGGSLGSTPAPAAPDVEAGTKIPTATPSFGGLGGYTAPTTPATTAPAGGFNYMDFVKQREGFAPQPYGDYKQTSIGYGTRANPGETSITREEADQRLGVEVSKARQLVQANFPGLSKPQEDALTDLTYNAGTKWMNSGLGQAAREGNWEAAKGLYEQYTNAGGEHLPGLASRRMAMSDKLLMSAYPDQAPAETDLAFQPKAPAAPDATRVASMEPTRTPLMRRPGEEAAPKKTSWIPDWLRALGPQTGIFAGEEKANFGNLFGPAIAAGFGGKGGNEMANALSTAMANSVTQGQAARRLQQDIENHRTAQLGYMPTGEKTLAREKHEDDLTRRNDTELSKNLDLAGLVPGSEEYKKAVLDYLNKSKEPKAESAYDTVIAKASGADVEARGKAIEESRNKLTTLAQIEGILKDPNVYTGKGGELALSLAKMGKAGATLLGVSEEHLPKFLAGVSNAELLNTISNKYALTLRTDMPGAMSDSDRNFLLDSVPGLRLTAEGNARIVQLSKQAEQYKMELNKAAQNYVHAKRSNVGLADYLDQWTAANPMVSEQQKQEIARAAQSTPEGRQAIAAAKAEREGGRAPQTPEQMQAEYAKKDGVVFNEPPATGGPAVPKMVVLHPTTGKLEKMIIQGPKGGFSNPHLPDGALGNWMGVPGSVAKPGEYGYWGSKFHKRTNTSTYNPMAHPWEEVKPDDPALAQQQGAQ